MKVLYCAYWVRVKRTTTYRAPVADQSKTEAPDQKESELQMAAKGIIAGNGGGSKGEETGRHLVTDEGYARTLAADFGIAERDVADALVGEPMARALRVCEWVERTDEKSPLQRGRVLTAWAKKNGAGRYARRNPGPSEAGGETKAPVRRERVKFSTAQIAANLDRMGA